MNSQTDQTEVNELSRPMHVAALAEAPLQEVEIVATADECDALAGRYALIALNGLTAQVSVRREPNGEIVAEGRLRAEVVQECVVTLEPVGDTVETTFEQRYTLQPENPAADLTIGPDDDEPPEPVRGESIDLGELVAQYLSLALNPYPRAPEADRQTTENTTEPAPDGPFAVLAKLRGPDAG